MANKKFLIIDANSLIHRAFHALPPLTTQDGKLINAVYGFTAILLKALKEFKPDYLVCCFDVSKDTFRRKKYKEYKAQRPEQPSELYHQFPLIKELLKAFKIPIYEKEGFEADDIIGTISHKINRNYKDIRNIIVSGDLDILQLVNDNTEVYTLKRGISETIIYNKKAVRERYGFGPEKLIDFKALRGDPSDNIPGVPGIGEKIASQLIQKFGSLDNIYKKAQEIQKYNKEDNLLKKNLVKKLLEHKKEAYLSQKLVAIVQNVKIKFDLKDCKVKTFDVQQVIKLFRAWQFNRLISQIPQAEKIMREKQGTLFTSAGLHSNAISQLGSGKQQPQSIKIKKGYHLIKTKGDMDKFAVELKKQKEFAIDTETDGLNPFKSNLIGISFSWKKGEAYYLPIEKHSALNSSELQNYPEIKKIIENPKIKKIGHNIKFDYEVLDHFGINLRGIAFDTMIASYLLNPGSRQHNLNSLAFTELGYKMQTIEELSEEKNKSKIDLSKYSAII